MSPEQMLHRIRVGQQLTARKLLYWSEMHQKPQRFEQYPQRKDPTKFVHGRSKLRFVVNASNSVEEEKSHAGAESAGSKTQQEQPASLAGQASEVGYQTAISSISEKSLAGFDDKKDVNGCDIFIFSVTTVGTVFVRTVDADGDVEMMDVGDADFESEAQPEVSEESFNVEGKFTLSFDEEAHSEDDQDELAEGAVVEELVTIQIVHTTEQGTVAIVETEEPRLDPLPVSHEGGSSGDAASSHESE
jgi:hypothetical protein